MQILENQLDLIKLITICDIPAIFHLVKGVMHLIGPVFYETANHAFDGRIIESHE